MAESVFGRPQNTSRLRKPCGFRVARLWAQSACASDIIFRCLFVTVLRLECAFHISGSRVNAVSQCAHMEHAPNDVGPCDVAENVIGRPQNTSSWTGSEAMRYLADFLSFPYSSLSSAPAAQTPVGSGQVLQGCANFNLDRNRNMPGHGLRSKASRQQEPRLPSQALTQGCISLLPYQLNNVKLHYLVVRNEALHSGEGVPGADCTAARTIGSYKSQVGREIILGSSSFGLGSHLQHTTAAVLRQSPPGRTLGLS